MKSRPIPGKLKFFASEKWATVRGYRGAQGQQYAISNYGRAIVFWKTHDYGYFLKNSHIRDYPSIQFRKDGKSIGHLIHRLVAQHFCERPSASYKFVIHLDHKKENNYYRNLKWVNRDEFTAHMLKDPNYINSRVKMRGRGQKLTEDRVKIIKQKIASGKTRMKILAKQFGISEMQLYRIKSGQNWGHVKV